MKQTKKTISAILLMLSLIALTLFSLPASAASPSASLSGTGSLRPGDTLTVTLSLNGSDLHALSGVLTYDSGKLSYSSMKELASGWDFEVQASDGSVRFIGIDDQMNAPINKSTKMLSVSFKVKSSLTAGTSVRVTAKELSASDGNNDFSISSKQYETSVLPPKSSNADLASLSVRQTSLTPGFSPDVKNYTAATVPYDVSSLTITAKAADSLAKVEISGNALAVGENTVKIKVTAENGNVNTYSIRVEREQDPNYVPSTDAALSALTLSAGQLSPAFSPEVRDYLVIVPFEVDQLTISGTPRDPLAYGCKEETVYLERGENLVSYFNRAEDGTEMAYVLHILRMPEYQGILPTVIPGTEAQETEPTPTETEPESQPETAKPETDAQTETAAPDTDALQAPPASTSVLSRLTDRAVLTVLLITSLIMLGIGLAVGILIAKPKKRQYRV